MKEPRHGRGKAAPHIRRQAVPKVAASTSGGKPFRKLPHLPPAATVPNVAAATSGGDRSESCRIYLRRQAVPKVAHLHPAASHSEMAFLRTNSGGASYEVARRYYYSCAIHLRQEFLAYLSQALANFITEEFWRVSSGSSSPRDFGSALEVCWAGFVTSSRPTPHTPSRKIIQSALEVPLATDLRR